MAKILMVVAQKAFKDEELLVPKEILEGEGHDVKIASISRAKATGVGGTAVQPDMAVHEANPEFFDALVIVGGPGSPVLAKTEEVLDLVRNANKQGKVVAAICLAPMALANAGVLSGKKATVYPSKDAIETLRSHDARYMEEPVVMEGDIITADCPASAGKFGNAIVQLLKEKNL
jgi:protease I